MFSVNVSNNDWFLISFFFRFWQMSRRNCIPTAGSGNGPSTLVAAAVAVIAAAAPNQLGPAPPTTTTPPSSSRAACRARPPHTLLSSPTTQLPQLQPRTAACPAWPPAGSIPASIQHTLPIKTRWVIVEIANLRKMSAEYGKGCVSCVPVESWCARARIRAEELAMPEPRARK
jgi:hypothetical protein